MIDQALIPADLHLYSTTGLARILLVNQATITHNQGVIMATVEQLKAQLDAIQATEVAEQAQLTTLGTALSEIIAMLQTSPEVPDAIVQQATDIATAALSNTSQAAALAAEAAGAVPPAP